MVAAQTDLVDGTDFAVGIRFVIRTDLVIVLGGIVVLIDGGIAPGVVGICFALPLEDLHSVVIIVDLLLV